MGQHRSRTRVEDGLEQLGRDRTARMPDRVDARQSRVQIAGATPIAGGRTGDAESRQLPVGDSPELAGGQLGDANLGELVRRVRTDLPRFEAGAIAGDSRRRGRVAPPGVGSTLIDSPRDPPTRMPHVPDLSGSALDDRYELHAVIGEGAFGRVYEGRDRRLERPVAVKVIKPWWAEDPEWVTDFERETRLLARISDPGIVQIYDVGHAPEGRYYVSELVSGENLAQRLRRGSIAPWQAAGIAAQLCRALAGAHAQRIVHRDVKPPNILLSNSGQVKVGDFGVAGLAEGSSGAGSQTIVGTPSYMAPEQSRGRPVSPATDVYSAGVVLYEMVAGALPFVASSAVELAVCHLQDPPPPLPASVPEPLRQISRGRWPGPVTTYADGGEMADALIDASRRAGERARERAGRSGGRAARCGPRAAPRNGTRAPR